MADKEVIIVGHHGTSKENAESIIKHKIYLTSDKDNEWLGKGVYFFINRNTNIAIENCKKWALRIQKSNDYCVLETHVFIKDDNLMNLDEDDWNDFFHKARIVLIRENIKKGIHVETSALKLDCYVIDKICKMNNIKVVIQKRFINFDKYYRRERIASSYVPNCCIMCVKEHDAIIRESIKVVKEG